MIDIDSTGVSTIGINSTGINTIVTLVAIGLTLISWAVNVYQWFRNRRLKSKITRLELIAYIDRFHQTYVKTRECMQKKKWYRGIDGAHLSHELSSTLSDYNRYCSHFNEKEREDLDSFYDEANKVYPSFFGENEEFIDTMLGKLGSIDRILQQKRVSLEDSF